MCLYDFKDLNLLQIYVGHIELRGYGNKIAIVILSEKHLPLFNYIFIKFIQIYS